MIDTTILDPSKRDQAFREIETLRQWLKNHVGSTIRPESLAEFNQRLDEIAKLFSQ